MKPGRMVLVENRSNSYIFRDAGAGARASGRISRVTNFARARVFSARNDVVFAETAGFCRITAVSTRTRRHSESAPVSWKLSFKPCFHGTGASASGVPGLFRG